MKGGVLLLGVEGGVQPFVSSVFESLGYRSRSVFDALQATEVLKNEGDAWNVILLDVDTSPDTAIGDCGSFLAASPHLCILATSTNSKEWTERLPSSPRIETIEKPFGVWGMESALTRLYSRLKGLTTPLEIEKSIDSGNLGGKTGDRDVNDSDPTRAYETADDDAPIN
jgi:hypothetical protein